MKKPFRLLLFGLIMIMLSGVAVTDTADHTRTADLKPSSPTDEWSDLELKPQEMAVYNVNIDEEGDVDGVNYRLDGDPSVTKEPKADADKLWIWEKTSGGNNLSYSFKVVNTVWDEKR